MTEPTCANHGDRVVDAVCGECGEPLCEDCRNEINDPTFSQYESSGTKRLIYALILVIGTPVLFLGVAPDLLPQFQRTVIFFKIITGLNTGVVFSSVIIGLGLFASLYYRQSDDLSDLSLLYRKSTKRILCDNCADQKKSSGLYYAITAAAVLFAILGIYLFVQTGLFEFEPASFSPIWVSSIGVTVYLLRDELVYWIKTGV